MVAFGGILAHIVFVILQAMFVMALLGEAHAQDGRVPNLGFWASFGLVVAFRVLTLHELLRPDPPKENNEDTD